MATAADRIFRVLDLFLDNASELSISELSKLSGFTPTVIHRIVKSLVKNGYLYQKGKRGKYSLGIKFFSFTNVINKNIPIIDIAMPHLLDLNKEINEAVFLGSIDKGQLLVIERIEANYDLQITGQVGQTIFLHSTSIGKIFLSQMSEPEQQSIFKDQNLEKFTTNTITDYNLMKKEFDLFRKTGCCYDNEEHMIGIWSIAAPIYGVSGRIEAGVSILVPTPRINPCKIKKYTRLIKSCTSKISQALGYRA